MLRQLLFLLIVPGALCAAEDGPVYRWQFSAAQRQRDVFTPVAGKSSATIVGPVSFGTALPRGLELSGGAKHRLIVADNSTKLVRPEKQITVEAWARVDQTREWGGLVSCLQDNGSFERGWLLGFRKSTFCFGLSSKNQKRLTYLTSSRMFEPGYWYHIVGTYDGKTMRLYVDGKLSAESKAQSGSVFYADYGPMTIGSYEDKDELFPTKGGVERVSIWNRALSAKDVKKEFNDRQKLFPGIIAEHPRVTDWPTHLRDNQRTGLVTYEFTKPEQMHWSFRQRHKPSPAWPAPASQDFWHKKFNLKARVVYDRASHIVSANGRVFFGSSTDDKVYCLNAETGELEWEFFTEGPVRLAPTVVNDRVLVGSDDGCLYCLSSSTGELLWKHRATQTDRRIAGNERVISVWPVRTGVLADEGVAWFCAGLFPQQGVHQIAVDVRTGKELARSKLTVSAQGYLARRAGRLFVATGRDPAGAFVSKLKRTGKGVGRELAVIPAKFRDVFIGSKNLRIGGGDGQIAAFDVKNGKQVWNAKVDGKVWSMAIAGQRLFVSTDAGLIYAFGADGVSAKHHSPARIDMESDPTARKLADGILEQTKRRKGYVLILNGTAKLARALAEKTEFQIVCLNSDTAEIAKSRRKIDALGLHGRVAFHHGDPSANLPYTDYLFNLVIDEKAVAGEAIASTPEMFRVTRPIDGVLMTGASENDIRTRPALTGAGEWSHMYANPANTVCSDDEYVGSDLSIQWFGRPGPQQMLDRHHRTVAPLWKNGRMFIPGNDRVIAVDAYNGTPLWNIAIPGSRRIGAYRDSSYMAASDDYIFVAAKNACLVMHAATGKIEKRIAFPKSTDGKYEWGYLAVDDKTVIGSASRQGAIRRDHSLKAINEGTFWDSRPLVCADRLFAKSLDGSIDWSYLPAQGVLVNSSVTVSDKHVFVAESTNPDTQKIANGRATPAAIFSKGSRITAIERQEGSVAWSVDLNLDKTEHSIHTAYADGKLVVVASRNSGKDKKTAQVLYDVIVVNATTGKVIWRKTQKQGTKIGGDHGEQDHHPVIVGDSLYCEPFAYKLNTGDELADYGWNKSHRRGCGNVSASKSAFFFRQSNATMFDLESNEYKKVTTTTRPGCWINMIPAGGLLLIPEASSGCTCNYSIQTSLAFLPRKPKPQAPE